MERRGHAACRASGGGAILFIFSENVHQVLKHLHSVKA
jgi:hypothetical protein